MSVSEAPAPAFSAVCRDLLASGLAIRFRANGDSMRPTIRDGEEIEVEPVGSALIRRGDIALYETSRGRMVCHRLLRMERGGELIFRGDAIWAGEDVVSAGRLLGLATAVIRNGSRRSLRGLRARLRDAARRLAGRVHGSMPR